MKKVELLAPAGNYEALTGALMAGADAVYLGGNAFGARAYADNFSKEEICEGIRYAHILGKKASCLLSVVDSHYKHQEISAEERQTSLNSMIKLALETSLKID